MRKLIILFVVVLITVLMSSCTAPAEVVKPLPTDEPTSTSTPIPTDIPTPTVTSTSLPTSTPTPTMTPTPERVEPLVVQVVWDLYMYYGYDVMSGLQSLIDFADTQNYVFTTFANIDNEPRAIVLIFVSIYTLDEGDLRDVWQFLRDQNIPIVVGIPGVIFDKEWSQSDVDFLKENLQAGWQIANQGTSNAGLGPDDPMVDVPYEITHAHSTITQRLGIVPSVLLLPWASEEKDPQIYITAESLSYGLVVGYDSCESCGSEQMLYYHSILLENFSP